MLCQCFITIKSDIKSLIFNYMNVDENFTNWNEKGEKMKWVNLQNDLHLGNQKAYQAENGIILLLGQYYTIL